MAKEARRDIGVWADWRRLGGPARMGALSATPTRGKEIFSFEYDPDWLRFHSGPLLLWPSSSILHGRDRFNRQQTMDGRGRRSETVETIHRCGCLEPQFVATIRGQLRRTFLQQPPGCQLESARTIAIRCQATWWYSFRSDRCCRTSIATMAPHLRRSRGGPHVRDSSRSRDRLELRSRR